MGRNLLGRPFPTFLPLSRLVRGNTNQVTSNASQGQWWHGSSTLGTNAQSFPADRVGAACPCNKPQHLITGSVQ